MVAMQYDRNGAYSAFYIYTSDLVQISIGLTFPQTPSCTALMVAAISICYPAHRVGLPFFG